MNNRVRAALITVLTVALLYALATIEGRPDATGLSNLGSAPAIGVTGIVFGVASYVTITGKYGPESVLEAASVVTLMYGGAALGLTEFSLKLLDKEILFLIFGLGTIPAAAGGAFAAGSYEDELLFGSVFVLVSLGSAFYLRGDLLNRVVLHTWAMVPGFLLAFVYTSAANAGAFE
ncbi:hypothetical protein LPA44_06380 [Halobacterium sp. KA-4]|uniref:hypothetical protein n=1 Tax=Halobacterium sp. KA-4 TaxID=2896367 RepID=UPI001E64B49A|nr:hypothetical protein [Halobacterium sp. KA-4]MCD2199522.1 hypothetical protein [Halobacterium sp. KA-4]